jgi:hypothetical protein
MRPILAGFDGTEPSRDALRLEAAAVLSDLREPGPDMLDRRVDRDGARHLTARLRNKLVAGHRSARLLFGRAPAKHPGPNRPHVEAGESGADHGTARGSPTRPKGA